MFLPIGGIFIFGGNGSGGVAINLFNVIMGALALLFGYMYGILFFQIIGYVIGGLGLFGLIFSIFTRRDTRSSIDEDTGKSSI